MRPDRSVGGGCHDLEERKRGSGRLGPGRPPPSVVAERCVLLTPPPRRAATSPPAEGLDGERWLMGLGWQEGT